MTQQLSDADVRDGRTAFGDVPRPAVRHTRVLAIGAHRGDILVGAGATLLSHHADGHQIDVVTLAGDEVGEHCSTAAVLGGSLTTGGFLACNIVPDHKSIEFLEHVIELIAPDVIYTHSANDHDRDHRNTNRAVLAAAGSVPSIYCFEMPTTTAGFAPTRYADVDEHLPGKLQLLARHPGRTACANVHPHVLTRMARHWGAFGSSSYAEPLEVEREGGLTTSPSADRRHEPAPVMV